MGRCRTRHGLLVAVALLSWLAPTVAPAEGKIDVHVMVTKLSEEPGAIDPRAKDLHAGLSKTFRYESLEVLQDEHLSLAQDELGTVKLPDGRELQVRPGEIGEHGLLMVVRIEGTVETELKAPSGHLSVLRAGELDGDTLVVSIRPTY